MTLLLLQIISCSAMTGLIWNIQILHYPTFYFVPETQFEKFHNFHSKNITFIVLPTMVLEFATSIALVVQNSVSILLWINFLGVVLIWLCTLLLSIPQHNVLAKNRSDITIHRLIATNWYRTILWSTRLALLLYIFLRTVKR